MKMIPPAAILAAWLLMIQAPGHASAPVVPQTPSAPQAAPKQAPHEVATHATKGVVKTVSATAIVITRTAAGKATDTSFVVTAATQRVGTIAEGAKVEIRYRTEGKQRIATAISVEAPPQ